MSNPCHICGADPREPFTNEKALMVEAAIEDDLRELRKALGATNTFPEGEENRRLSDATGLLEDARFYAQDVRSRWGHAGIAGTLDALVAEVERLREELRLLRNERAYTCQACRGKFGPLLTTSDG